MFDWYMELMNQTLGMIDDCIYKFETWVRKLFGREPL